MDATAVGRMQQSMQQELPLDRKLIVKAWEYFFQEDFRNTVIYSAMVIEWNLTRIVRRSFSSGSVGTSSQIDRFIDQTSKRLLCTVILGLLGIGDSNWRNELANILELRNSILHGGRKDVGRQCAELALNRTEELSQVLENENMAGSDST